MQLQRPPFGNAASAFPSLQLRLGSLPVPEAGSCVCLACPSFGEAVGLIWHLLHSEELPGAWHCSWRQSRSVSARYRLGQGASRCVSRLLLLCRRHARVHATSMLHSGWKCAAKPSCSQAQVARVSLNAATLGQFYLRHVAMTSFMGVRPLQSLTLDPRKAVPASCECACPNLFWHQNSTTNVTKFK